MGSMFVKAVPSKFQDGLAPAEPKRAQTISDSVLSCHYSLAPAPWKTPHEGLHLAHASIPHLL